MPMVVMKDGLNLFSTNRNIIHVLPTPLSPIRSNLNKKSNCFSMWLSRKQTFVHSSDNVSRSGTFDRIRRARDIISQQFSSDCHS